MSRSVFNRNKTKSTVADNIISKMDDDENPDMNVKFKGYMHGGRGFALEVLNLESLTETTLNLWKSIIEGEGLQSYIKTDIMSGKVNIQCTPVVRRKRPWYLFSLAYLSLSLVCIYLLWTRHQM